ncbi:MAG: hypothetical protein WCK05_05295, partial [Planctomycetota bacterium]
PLLPTQPPKPDPTPAQALSPGQTIEAFSVDLRGFIDMSRPGAYRVRVLFDDKTGGFARGYTDAVTVRVTEK